jgi:hypothetical protein
MDVKISQSESRYLNFSNRLVQSGVFCWMGALLLLEEVREENLSVNENV